MLQLFHAEQSVEQEVPFACTLRLLVFIILIHSVFVSKRSLRDGDSKGGACLLLFFGTQYCWYEFGRVPGRAGSDRGEIALESLPLLLLLHGVLYIRCCPFLSRTVTVNLLAPRVVAGCLLRAGGRARSRASCAEAGKVPGIEVAGVF